MANVACGNACLGHGHALSLPLEGHLDLPHPYGVGGLLPHVIEFNLAVLPHKVAPLAEALEVQVAGLTRAEQIEACAASIRGLYADIGFAERFTAEQLPRQRVREMAERAVPGLYAGIAAQDFDPASAGDPRTVSRLSRRCLSIIAGVRCSRSVLPSGTTGWTRRSADRVARGDGFPCRPRYRSGCLAGRCGLRLYMRVQASRTFWAAAPRCCGLVGTGVWVRGSLRCSQGCITLHAVGLNVDPAP